MAGSSSTKYRVCDALPERQYRDADSGKLAANFRCLSQFYEASTASTNPVDGDGTISLSKRSRSGCGGSLQLPLLIVKQRLRVHCEVVQAYTPIEPLLCNLESATSALSITCSRSKQQLRKNRKNVLPVLEELQHLQQTQRTIQLQQELCSIVLQQLRVPQHVVALLTNFRNERDVADETALSFGFELFNAVDSLRSVHKRATMLQRIAADHRYLRQYRELHGNINLIDDVLQQSSDLLEVAYGGMFVWMQQITRRLIAAAAAGRMRDVDAAFSPIMQLHNNQIISAQDAVSILRQAATDDVDCTYSPLWLALTRLNNRPVYLIPCIQQILRIRRQRLVDSFHVVVEGRTIEGGGGHDRGRVLDLMSTTDAAEYVLQLLAWLSASVREEEAVVYALLRLVRPPPQSSASGALCHSGGRNHLFQLHRTGSDSPSNVAPALAEMGTLSIKTPEDDQNEWNSVIATDLSALPADSVARKSILQRLLTPQWLLGAILDGIISPFEHRLRKVVTQESGKKNCVAVLRVACLLDRFTSWIGPIIRGPDQDACLVVAGTRNHDSSHQQYTDSSINDVESAAPWTLTDGSCGDRSVYKREPLILKCCLMLAQAGYREFLSLWETETLLLPNPSTSSVRAWSKGKSQGAPALLRKFSAKLRQVVATLVETTTVAFPDNPVCPQEVADNYCIPSRLNSGSCETRLDAVLEATVAPLLNYCRQVAHLMDSADSTVFLINAYGCLRDSFAECEGILPAQVSILDVLIKEQIQELVTLVSDDLRIRFGLAELQEAVATLKAQKKRGTGMSVVAAEEVLQSDNLRDFFRGFYVALYGSTSIELPYVDSLWLDSEKKRVRDESLRKLVEAYSEVYAYSDNHSGATHTPDQIIVLLDF